MARNGFERIQKILDETSLLLSDETKQFNKRSIKLFLLFGPYIPYGQMTSIYLLLLIVCLQRFFYYNSPTVLQYLLSYYFKVFQKNDYLLEIITYAFFILSPLFGYIADRKGICHAKIMLSSLIIGVLAGIFILVALGVHYSFMENKSFSCSINITTNNLQKIEIQERYICSIAVIIGLVLFSIHACLFHPFGFIYGLDLLEGAPTESFLMLFPMIYVAVNFGALFQYLVYFKFNPNQFIIHYSLISFALVLSTFLFILGMLCNVFPSAISSQIGYTFSETFTIPFRALRNRLKFGRPSGNNPFLYLATIGTSGFPLNSVNRTISMLKLHLAMIFILPVFSVDRVMYTLLSQQAQTLYLDVIPYRNKTDYYCDSYCQVSSYSFIPELTAISFCAIMEYFFYRLTFGYRKDSFPWFFWCLDNDSLIKKYYKNIKAKLNIYFNNADPILKKMFLCYPLGMLAISSSLVVELVKRNHYIQLVCQNSFRYVTTLPLSVQTPQYIFTTMAEAIVFINFGQYILLYTAKDFHSSFRGCFMGFFWFYYGLGGIMIDSLNGLLASICEKSECGTCFVYSSKCSKHKLDSLWVIWVFILVIYTMYMFAFFFFSHYKHWKLNKIQLDNEDQGDEEIECERNFITYNNLTRNSLLS